MKLIACCIALLAAWTSPLHAQTDDEVKKLVRDYFTAFQACEWKTIVAMYHPQTLVKHRDTILVVRAFPKTSAEVIDKERAYVAEMLEILKVKTPEEAWELPAADFYQRMLEFAGRKGVLDGVREAKITILNIDVVKKGREFHADAEFENVREGMLYPVITHFILEPIEGELKIVSMTKTRREPREIEEEAGEEDDDKPEAAAPEVEPGPAGKPKAE